MTDSIVIILSRSPALVGDVVLDLAPDIRKRRPSPNRWSAHEHAVHLGVVEDVFGARLAAMADSPDPVLEAYDPPQEHTDGALLDVDGWLRTGRHPQYGRYDVKTMARHFAFHDMFHAYRIEEALWNARA